MCAWGSDNLPSLWHSVRRSCSGGPESIRPSSATSARDLRNQLQRRNQSEKGNCGPRPRLNRSYIRADVRNKVSEQSRPPTRAQTKALALLKSVWLSGLFNSMSFLTSNMQVAARSNNLPLDFMVNRCRFYNIRDVSEVTCVPPQGVNVHGLYMEGAGWEDGKGEDEGYINESKMKELHPQMPICNIFAVHIDEMDWNCMYHCPVFSTSLRGATFIFQANVRMDPDEKESRWILAGAAMLTQDD